MQRALALAERARGNTKPNPMVGAVVVRNGNVVGEGYHHRAGTDHAEVLALKQAGKKAAGATIYVTLEPCCHVGNTPPCTNALIAAGIKRVVIPNSDPDPRVKGRGIRVLRKAGIQVDSGVLRREAERLNDIYFGFKRNNRPYVILKSAQSLDGRIATAGGDSKWITGPEARKIGHEYRRDVDGIVVGMGTVRADNPSLTVRHVRGANPYRIIATTSGRFPRRCNLLQQNQDFRTIVATTGPVIEKLSRRKNAGGLIFWEVGVERDGLLSVADIVARAGEFGLQSLLVEGGAALATSFWKAQLVDKYLAFIAPRIIGDGRAAVGELEIRKVAGAIKLARPEIEPCGADFLYTAYPEFERQ